MGSCSRRPCRCRPSCSSAWCPPFKSPSRQPRPCGQGARVADARRARHGALSDGIGDDTRRSGFSMVLLVLAGLFTQSLVNIARVDLGMNAASASSRSPSAADESARRDGLDGNLRRHRGGARRGARCGERRLARIALLTRRGSTSARRSRRRGCAGRGWALTANDVSPGSFTEAPCAFRPPAARRRQRTSNWSRDVTVVNEELGAQSRTSAAWPRQTVLVLTFARLSQMSRCSSPHALPRSAYHPDVPAQISCRAGKTTTSTV